MKTYIIQVTREGDHWLADAQDVPGAHTHARSLGGLQKAAREVVILMDDLDDDAQPELELRFDARDSAIAAAAELARERRDFTQREQDIQKRTAAAAIALTTSGLSVRDSAAILGITAGRISQLTNA